MGGDNMESLLLQGDDSSSGESDSEVALSGSGGGATAASAAKPASGSTTPVVPQGQQQLPVASAAVEASRGVAMSAAATTVSTNNTAISSSTAPPPSMTSHSDMAARLKSMYSPATKSNQQAKQQQQQPQGGLPPSSTTPAVATIHPSMSIQTQQQQQGATLPSSSSTQIPLPQQLQQQKSLTQGSQSTPMNPPPKHQQGIYHRSTSSGMHPQHPITMPPGQLQQQQQVQQSGVPNYATATTSRPNMMMPPVAAASSASVGGGGGGIVAPQQQQPLSQSSYRRTSGGSTMSSVQHNQKGGIPPPTGPPPQQQLHQSYAPMSTGSNTAANTAPPAPSRSSMMLSQGGGRIMSSSSNSGGVNISSTAAAADPYEPTPVSTIIERSKQQHMKQQQHHQSGSASTINSGGVYNQQSLPPSAGGGVFSSGAPPSIPVGGGIGGQTQPVPPGVGSGGMVGQSTKLVRGVHQRPFPPGGGVGAGGSVNTVMSGSGSVSSGTSGVVGSVAGGAGQQLPSAATGMSRADREREMKKYKERFLIFTRVLMKYLEQKDPALHQQVKAIIKDCADRNKRQEPGYESVTASMRSRLQAVVHESYWKKAESYLDHFLKGKAKGGSASAGALSGVSFGATAVPSMSSTTNTSHGNGPSSISNNSAMNPDEMRRKQEMERMRMQVDQQGSSSSSHPSRSMTQQQAGAPHSSLVPSIGTSFPPSSASTTQQPLIPPLSQEEKRRQSISGGRSSNNGQDGVAHTSTTTGLHQPTSMPGLLGVAEVPGTTIGGALPDAKKGLKGRVSKSASIASAPQSRKYNIGGALTPSAAVSNQLPAGGIGLGTGGNSTAMTTDTFTPTASASTLLAETSVHLSQAPSQTTVSTPSLAGIVTTSVILPTNTPQAGPNSSTMATQQQQQHHTKPVLPPPPPPREYSEYMELVDHAVNYDWTVAGLLMDKEQVEILSAEQRTLFEETKRSLPTSYASKVPPSSSSPQTHTTMTLRYDSTFGSMSSSFPIPGWGKRNVLSARSAWALVRLDEESSLHFRSIGSSNANDSSNPIVGNGLLSLPPISPPEGQQKIGSFPLSNSVVSHSAISNTISTNQTSSEHTWYNEEKTEEDKVLAVISEGLQIYLKGVLEKAVHCARQRYNVDGIRLWHQQTALALKMKAASKESNSNKKDAGPNNTGAGSAEVQAVSSQLPLMLRLGCDVTRQVAQAAGNAAMTVKRMEEALERQSALRTVDVFTAETETACLLQAPSMSDLALLPKLARAVQDADICGKRSFEIFGGKYSSIEPPLGRIPKQPKLEVVDFQLGMNFYNTTLGRRGGTSKRRSRAGTLSSSFCY